MYNVRDVGNQGIARKGQLKEIGDIKQLRMGVSLNQKASEISMRTKGSLQDFRDFLGKQKNVHDCKGVTYKVKLWFHSFVIIYIKIILFIYIRCKCKRGLNLANVNRTSHYRRRLSGPTRIG